MHHLCAKCEQNSYLLHTDCNHTMVVLPILMVITVVVGHGMLVISQVKYSGFSGVSEMN